VQSFMTREGVSADAQAAFGTQQVHLVHHHDPAEGSNALGAAFHHEFHGVHYPLLIMSLIAVLIGIGASAFLFVKRRGVDFVAQIPPLAEYRRVLQNLYFVDWFYCERAVPTFKDVADGAAGFDKRVIDGTVNGVARLFGRDLGWFVGRFDDVVVDGAVNGTGALMRAFGAMFRGMVTGRIQDYVKFTAVCMGVLLLWVIATG